MIIFFSDNVLGVVVTLNKTHSHISLFIRLAYLNKIKHFAVFKSTVHESVLFINTIFLIDIYLLTLPRSYFTYVCICLQKKNVWSKNESKN